MVPRLRDSRVLASSGCGARFTQPLADPCKSWQEQEVMKLDTNLFLIGELSIAPATVINNELVWSLALFQTE